jgi:vancomycin resistance protein YoaR
MATETFTTTTQEAPSSPSRRSRSRLHPAILVTIATLLLLVAGAVAYMVYQHNMDVAQRVAPAVQVGGVQVGGLTTTEAQATLAEHFAGLPDSQILIRLDGRTWTFTARDLGISLNTAATAQAAKQAGRDVTTAPDIPLVLDRDRATAEAALHTVAADVAVAAQDATVAVDTDGIRVTPEQAGRRLDLDATWQALVAGTQSYPFGEVAAQTAEVAPRIHDADIAPALATIHRLSDEPIALVAHPADGKDRSWTIDPTTLRTWLQISVGANGIPAVQDKLDPARVLEYVHGLAPSLAVPAKDASLALPNYATVAALTPDLPGEQLNDTASVERIQAAAGAAGDARAADVILEAVPAAVSATALQPLKDQLDAAMHDGLALVAGDKTFQVTGAQLALVLYVQPSPAGAALPYQITVNDNDLNRLVARIAGSVDQAAVNATYRMVGNQVTLAIPPQDGVKIDRAAQAAVIKDALLSGKKTAALATVPVKPTFADTTLADQISTPDLLQSDSTFYGSSSAERNWNVTFGASKLDGWLIAPGAVFSLDDALGPLTLDAGFKMGWAILVQAGNATTIPAEAGGICQVATTLFHPVFWAGLPMVERHHHSYWISLYGQAPLGMQGLDATISPPDTDFQFKNTTGNWLLIRAKGDHTNLRVELWGTNPGWRVQVDKPVITDIVKTDTKPRYETSDKLESGRQVVVEHAQDGFTSDIHRQVFDKDGKKIDDWHAQGTYLPSHNTTVTGTGPRTSPSP